MRLPLLHPVPAPFPITKAVALLVAVCMVAFALDACAFGGTQDASPIAPEHSQLDEPSSENTEQAAVAQSSAVQFGTDQSAAQPKPDAAPAQPDDFSAAPDSFVADDASKKEFPEPSSLDAETVVSQEQIETFGEDAYFTVEDIDDATFARMDGVTFPADCPVTREQLRYIRVLHVDAAGATKVGEIVANEAIAQDLCEIFLDLYHDGYPIERMRLADDYGGNDEESMRDNNTSCFCCRPVEGTGAQSRHSYGMAIDVNPLYNPYIMATQDIVLPETARPYADRSVVTPYFIDPADACCQAFVLRGFFWGGDWMEPKDYQHFEK